MHGVDCLADGHPVTPQELQDCVERQGVELRKGDVVLVRMGRMTKWPDFDGYLVKPPGINLDSRQVALRGGRGDVHRGRHDRARGDPARRAERRSCPCTAYMFATAGAQIIEVVNMEEIAAEKQYEFAFLGFPMKIRGATGAPMPSVAVPLK